MFALFLQGDLYKTLNSLTIFFKIHYMITNNLHFKVAEVSLPSNHRQINSNHSVHFFRHFRHFVEDIFSRLFVSLYAGFSSPFKNPSIDES